MPKAPTTADDFRKVNQQLRELKRRFETSLKDEQDAVDMYSEIVIMADGIDSQLFSRKITDIKNQEAQHAQSFGQMMRRVDDIISMNERTIRNLQEFEAENRNKRYGRR